MRQQDSASSHSLVPHDVPTIDLHGIVSVSEAEILLEQQLYALVVAKETHCLVVHGIGEGRMKDMVHEVLSHHPLVHEYLRTEDGGGTLVSF